MSESRCAVSVMRSAATTGAIHSLERSRIAASSFPFDRYSAPPRDLADKPVLKEIDSSYGVSV